MLEIVEMAALPPEPPPYVALIRAAAVDKESRALAADLFAQVMHYQSPLAADHGSHHPRASDIGRCSLEYCADIAGLLDLDRADDTQLMLDSGTIMGAWLACLLKAGIQVFNLDMAVMLEAPTSYRGSRGTIDVLVSHFNESGPREVLEIKTTPSSGEIKPPDTKKIGQCLQAGLYAAGEAVERFTILTYGANIGANKAGIPYPKLVAHTYKTADFVPLVDAEIDRLTALAALGKDEVLARSDELADAADAYRCQGCRYSACPRNLNAMRFAL